MKLKMIVFKRSLLVTGCISLAVQQGYKIALNWILEM